MKHYKKNVFQNVISAFLLIAIVLLKGVENKHEKVSGESPVLFTNSGLLPFKKTDVAWTIYVTVQNIGDSPLHVVGRMLECCEMIGDENDCKSMRIMGSSLALVQGGHWKNITFLFPNMYLYNRRGECTVEIWYKDKMNMTDFITATIPFDTYVRNGVVPAFMKMWGPLEELTKSCEGPDADPLDGCRPVDCHKKYNGNKNYFSSLRNQCILNPTCYSNPAKELPDIAYVPTCNECIDLEQPIGEEDMRRLLRTRTCNETACKAHLFTQNEYSNIRCHHGEFNCETKMCDCDIGWTSAPIPEDIYLPSTLHLHFCTIKAPSGQLINTDPVYEALINQEPKKVILTALYLSLILVLLVILCIGIEKKMSKNIEKNERETDSKNMDKSGDVILNFFTVAESSDESERIHLQPKDKLKENFKGTKDKYKKNRMNQRKNIPSLYEKSLVVHKCRDKGCIGDIRFISGNLQRKKCGYLPDNVKYRISKVSENSSKKVVNNSFKRSNFPISSSLRIIKKQTYISRSPLKRLLRNFQKLFANNSSRDISTGGNISQLIKCPRNYNAVMKLFENLKEKVKNKSTDEVVDSEQSKEINYNFNVSGAYLPISKELSKSRAFKDEFVNKMFFQGNVKKNSHIKSEWSFAQEEYMLDPKRNSSKESGIKTDSFNQNPVSSHRSNSLKGNLTISTATADNYFDLSNVDESLKSTCVGTELQKNTILVKKNAVINYDDLSTESFQNTCYSALKFVENTLSHSTDSSETTVNSESSAKESQETLEKTNTSFESSTGLKSQSTSLENSSRLTSQTSENKSSNYCIKPLSQNTIIHRNDFKETSQTVCLISEESDNPYQTNVEKNSINYSLSIVNKVEESILSDLLNRARESLHRSKNDLVLPQSVSPNDVLYRLFKGPKMISRSFIPVLKSGQKGTERMSQSEGETGNEGLTVSDGSNGKKTNLSVNKKDNSPASRTSSESSLSYDEVSFKKNDLTPVKTMKTSTKNPSATKVSRSKKERKIDKRRMLNPYEKASEVISKCLKYVTDQNTKIKASDIMGAFCKKPNFSHWKNMLRMNGIETDEDDLKRAYKKIIYLEKLVFDVKKFIYGVKEEKNPRKQINKDANCLVVFCRSESEAKRYFSLAKHLMTCGDGAVPLDTRTFPSWGLIRLGPAWPVRHLIAALQTPGGRKKAFLLTSSPDTLDNLERLAVALARVRLHRELRVHRPQSEDLLYSCIIDNLIRTKRKSTLTRKLPHLFILWRALLLVPEWQIDRHSFARAMNFLSTIFHLKMSTDAHELHSDLIRAESIFLDFYCAKSSNKTKKIPFRAIESLLKSLSTMKDRESVLQLVTEQVENINQSVSLAKSRPVINNVISQLKRDLENAMTRYNHALYEI